LLISPIIAGLVLSSVGAIIRRWGKKVTPVETLRIPGKAIMVPA